MPAAPIIPKIITFSLGGTDFSTDVLDVAVVPEPGAVQKVKTLDGVTHQDAEGVSWSLTLRAIQDWSSTRPGLAYYLYDHAGENVAFVLNLYGAAQTAGSTTEPTVNGTVTVVPIPYGGEGNTFIEAEVSMPCTVDPVVDITP
jgi:hypothetical protein